MSVVILTGPDRGMGELLEELRAAAGEDARTAVTTGHGGVVVTDEVALRWLAARAGTDLPVPAGKPAARPTPTRPAQPAPKATKAPAKSPPVRPRKTTNPPGTKGDPK